eukprot:TRINITY_DN10009_c0_g1_i1.p1 TRINITY_DN10009_c0_g1~~TRINITY_DN10009_c0_g1_i1.p1  ORF type:complete len:804 (-),score=225.31 TRINITY_DN10009_c0_g1_i1:21-2432(-)
MGDEDAPFHPSGMQEEWAKICQQEHTTTLGVAGIKQVLRNFGLGEDGANEEVLTVLVKQLDTDGDGRISFTEFLDGMTTFMHQRAQANDSSSDEEFSADVYDVPKYDLSDDEMHTLSTLFAQFDKDGSNLLNEEELINLHSNLTLFLEKYIFSQSAADPTLAQNKDSIIEIVTSFWEELLSYAKYNQEQTGIRHLTKDNFLNVMSKIFAAIRLLPTKSAPNGNTTNANEAEDDDDEVEIYSHDIDDATSNSQTYGNNNLATRSAKKKTMQGEVIRLKMENKSLRDRVTQLNRKIDEGVEINERLESELNSAQNNFTAQTKELTKLQFYKSKLKRLNDEKEKSKEELSEKESVEKQLRKEIFKHKLDLNALQNDLAKADHQVRSLQADKENLEAKISTLRKGEQARDKENYAKVLEMSAEVEVLVEKKHELKMIVRRYEADLQRMRNQMVEKEDVLDSCILQIKQLQTSNERFKRLLAEAKTKSNAAQDSLMDELNIVENNTETLESPANASGTTLAAVSPAVISPTSTPTPTQIPTQTHAEIPTEKPTEKPTQTPTATPVAEQKESRMIEKMQEKFDKEAELLVLQEKVAELSGKVKGLEEELVKKNNAFEQMQERTLTKEKMWRGKQGKFMALQVMVKEGERIARDRQRLIAENERLLRQNNILRLEVTEKAKAKFLLEERHLHRIEELQVLKDTFNQQTHKLKELQQEFKRYKAQTKRELADARRDAELEREREESLDDTDLLMYPEDQVQSSSWWHIFSCCTPTLPPISEIDQEMIEHTYFPKNPKPPKTADILAEDKKD